jgi:hypothetical protein
MFHLQRTAVTSRNLKNEKMKNLQCPLPYW